MSKAKELKTTTEIVKDILTHDSFARNSDDYLIYLVCKRINPSCVSMPFVEVMANRKSLGLPVFESIRRAGQKVREKHPELSGSPDVEAQRLLNEEVFRKYARS